MNIQPPSYRRHRVPSEVISHAVWLFHRFCLSFAVNYRSLRTQAFQVWQEAVGA